MKVSVVKACSTSSVKEVKKEPLTFRTSVAFFLSRYSSRFFIVMVTVPPWLVPFEEITASAMVTFVSGSVSSIVAPSLTVKGAGTVKVK